MTDWSNPSLSQLWADFVSAIKGRDESNAKMDYSSDSNIPDGTIRWNAGSSKFEVWDNSTSSWGDLASTYGINVQSVGGVQLSGLLQSANDLSDLNSASTARSNLELKALATRATVAGTHIDPDAVSNTKLSNMAAATVKGRANGAGSGDPVDLSAGQLLGILETQSELSMVRVRATSPTNADLSSTTHGLQVGPTSSNNVAISDTRIQARDNGAAAAMSINLFGGEVIFGDDITATGDGTFNTSDVRLKRDWQRLDGVLDKMGEVLGGRYRFTQEAGELHHSIDPEQIRLGFSAQDIQRHWPEAVAPAPFDTDRDGNSISGEHYLTIRYEHLVPVLWQAVLDLKHEVDELKKAN